MLLQTQSLHSFILRNKSVLGSNAGEASVVRNEQHRVQTTLVDFVITAQGLDGNSAQLVPGGENEDLEPSNDAIIIFLYNW